MLIIIVVLLPINYHGGKGKNAIDVGGRFETFNITGLDTLSWQNVAPTQTNRYWAHLVCAVLAIGWTLYRLYCEKTNFISVRQKFLTSPEHRLKASARTVLITNIPTEYRSKDALEALYDVFVDNDDRSRLTIWLNRDYGLLKTLVNRRRSLRHALEKEELRILRLVNIKGHKGTDTKIPAWAEKVNTGKCAETDNECGEDSTGNGHDLIAATFNADRTNLSQLWRTYLKPSTAPQISLVKGQSGRWVPHSIFKPSHFGKAEKVPKIAWLRAEIARLNILIDEYLPDLDNDKRFPKQNSAFVQFDRQMSAHMACSLTSHEKAGRMSPRYVGVAPHEIIWANMNVTSSARSVRMCLALFLFLAILFLWGLPTTFLGFLSQLGALRSTTSWLMWLRSWPSWVISIIAGQMSASLAAY